MFGLTCSSACKPSEPATSTVRVNLDNLPESPRAQDLSRRLAEQREKEAADAQKREKEEERLRKEQEAQVREEEAARLKEGLEEEEARRKAEEAERLAKEEIAQRQQRAAEERSRREAEARATAMQERLSRKEEAKQRKVEVAAFLKKGGFSDVNVPKRSFFSKTYPIHRAAESGDDKLVAMLLQAGANAAQKNSAGRTAAQVAAKNNTKGSHNKVLSILAAPGSALRAGGA